jgi:hypothetical protein
VLDYMGEKYKISKNEAQQMLDEDSVNPILNDEQRNRLYISELRK